MLDYLKIFILAVICITFGVGVIWWCYGMDFSYVMPAFSIGALVAITILYVDNIWSRVSSKCK